MATVFHPDYEAEITLKRLLPRVENALKKEINKDPEGWHTLITRIEQYFPVLFELYLEVYRSRYDFFYYLEDLLVSIGRAWFQRSTDLRQLDLAREGNPQWFQSNQMVGGVIYVDRFAETLEGAREKIPYFKELGLTYLHLMPLFEVPEGENDGGYAVSSYRDVHKPLGTMQQLSELAANLRAEGISLVVDLIFNHTSDEHIWARKAKQGDDEHLHYYRIYKDREMPNQYEEHLREIFPEEHGGVFTFFPEIFNEGAWVWTTFHSYQWDLNYANPAVFNRMVEEMLFLANQGVEVIRLDAVAFIWKELGTNCENLPQAHALIRAFNAVARMAAPSLIFKSEAIVHPDEVVKYISPYECQLSYNPLLMALLWNSLATRKVRMLSQALATRFAIHPYTAWVNYVRVHDDIGWTFSDEDAAVLGVNGFDHRQFLNEFYRGRFEGSFARGLPFQENTLTKDCRISGTCASLAGLEKAIHEEGDDEIELAIRRILLIHGVIMFIGGIPLLYLGDEIGTLNDYSYQDNPLEKNDSRWVHRPKTDWEKVEERKKKTSIEGRVFTGLQKLIKLRKKYKVFSGGNMEVFWTGNDHVLGFVHTYGKQKAIILANFSESAQTMSADALNGQTIMDSKCIHGTELSVTSNGFEIEALGLVVYRR
jgi:amylosucrase